MDEQIVFSFVALVCVGTLHTIKWRLWLLRDWVSYWYGDLSFRLHKIQVWSERYLVHI